MNSTSKKIWNGITIFVLTIGVYLISVLFRAIPELPIIPIGGFEASFLFSGVCFYIFAYFATEYYQKRISFLWIVILLLVGISVVELPVRIINFNRTLISLPDFLVKITALFLGSLCARFCSRKKQIILTFAFLGFIIWGAFVGYKLYANWLSFSSATGRVERQITNPIVFTDEKGESVDLTEFRGKYVLLDIWHTRCGYCYAAMPDFQAIYNSYRNDDRIILRSVHCRNEEQQEDFTTGAQIINSRNFSFPCLSLPLKGTELAEMGVSGFPTFLIVDPEGILIYRGNISGARKYIGNILETSKHLYNYGVLLNNAEYYKQSNTILRECVDYLNDYDIQLLFGDNYYHTEEINSAIKHYITASHMIPCRFVPLSKIVGSLHRDWRGESSDRSRKTHCAKRNQDFISNC